jgi:hypothetical protein
MGAAKKTGTKTRAAKGPRAGSGPIDVDDPDATIRAVAAALPSIARSDLRKEALEAFANGPPVAAFYHDQMAAAYHEYLSSLARRCRALVEQCRIAPALGIRLSDGTTVETDFELAGFDEAERRYRSSLTFLASSGSLASTLAIAPTSYVAAFGTGGVFAGPGLKLPWWLNKLLSLFGIEEEDLADVGATLIEELGVDNVLDIEDRLDRVYKAVIERRLDDARKLINQIGEILERILLRLMDTDTIIDFFERLAERIGKRLGGAAARKKASKLAGKIASKFLPILGWLLTILELVYLLLKDVLDAYI